MSFREINGTVTTPAGFLASGVRAGIKEQGEDLALIVSERHASAAGVFTRNVIRASPVEIDSTRVPGSTVRAIVVNSGNANACTGDAGYQDALQMARETAALLEVPEQDVLVASTGIIGKRLPMDKVLSGIRQARATLSDRGGELAARAIMTTDTRPKTACVEFDLGGKVIRIGGIAKGAGMICPNMATMLAFVTTDAAIAPDLLQSCLSKSAEISFNCLTIDGDSSTNDTVLILANGASGCPQLGGAPRRQESSGDRGSNSLPDNGSPDDSRRRGELDAFQEALDFVTISLAKQIAMDGEGATKFIEIKVEGADSFDDARQVAKTIANSPLVKTAMFGKDPNWGRVLAAAGRAGVDFNPADVNLSFGPITLVKSGEPTDFSEQQAHDYLANRDVAVLLRIGSGPGSATVWTCDFSYDYVRINAEYHT